MRIKKGDTVEVISGDDKGTRGTVRRVIPGREVLPGRTPAAKGHVRADHERDLVLVSGVNIVKKHQRRTGDAKTQVGIIEREAPVRVSNVALVCPHCQKASRVGIQITDDGGRLRVCKSCHQTIE